MEIKVYVESAFCKNDGGGNKAGVVLFNEGLSVHGKKTISRRLGYAETVFVTKSDLADFRLEYFTPSEEVPLCGHATIAAFALMQNLMMLNKCEYSFETKMGILSVNIENGKIFMEQTRPEFFETIKKAEFERSFDIDCVSERYPAQIVSTGLRDIMLPIKNMETLTRITPNFEEITAISETYDTVGIHAFVIQNGRIICRNFAPRYDVPEESATGTSNCALACYLHKNDVLRKNEYIMEQGYSLNLPSEIIVRLMEDGDVISGVCVGGEGYFVEEKYIEI